MLTASQKLDLQAMLIDRHRVLRAEIQQELLDSEEETFIELAGQVRDLEEESVADLLVDLDLAVIDLHIEELSDIEAARGRMQDGSYGTCIDCGKEIDFDRLQAWPTAKRCLKCQQLHERNHAGYETPSL